MATDLRVAWFFEATRNHLRRLLLPFRSVRVRIHNCCDHFLAADRAYAVPNVGGVWIARVTARSKDLLPGWGQCAVAVVSIPRAHRLHQSQQGHDLV